MRFSRSARTRYRTSPRTTPKRPKYVIATILIALAVLVGWYFWSNSTPQQRQSTQTKNRDSQAVQTPATGKLTEQGEVISLTAEQTEALIRQTNKSYSGKANPVKQQTFRYTMLDTNGETVQVYGRAFVPSGGPSKNLSVYAFAPGTTGIDDQCAPSLEVPAKRNLANYASHMAAYASEGYAVVTIDYEGFRDPSRMHHYMVGALEGRALLDGVRALSNLPLSKDRISKDSVFLAGYSQGGHAAFWADEIAASYAPELTIKGVVGFGPVTDVRQTLTDTTRGANILWFGPYVLYSYADWYKESYPLNSILMPPFAANLASDIAKNCIDTNIQYWGNRDITKVYTKQFIDAMKTGSVAAVSPAFDERMRQNLAADVKTPSRKLIVHGRQDNVVLVGQSDVAVKRLCSLGNSVNYRVLKDATHYTTMAQSFSEVIQWMGAARAGTQVSSDCR